MLQDRIVVTLFLSFIISTIGCAQNGLTNNSNLEAKYKKVALEFGEALMSEDYAKAWSFASSDLKNSMSLEDFSQAHADARKEYGVPLKLDVDYNTLDPQDLQNAAEYGFSAEIPQDIRRAWMAIQMGIELDEEGDIYRSCECWFLLVEEDGAEKVAHFEYRWTD